MSKNNESTSQENQAESKKSPEQEFSALRTLSRLAVGGMLEGADEVRRRLEQWEKGTGSVAEGKEEAEEAEVERLRYALIGMLLSRKGEYVGGWNGSPA